MEPSEQSTADAEPRPRTLRPTKRACVDCHARKVRCDGAVNGFPCTNCKSAGVQCAVKERRKRMRVSVKTTETRPPRQEYEAGQVEEADPEGPRAARAPSATPGLEGRPNEHRPASDKEYAGDYELAKEHLVEFFKQNLQDSPIRSRLTYVGTELSNLNYLTRQLSGNHLIHHYPCSNAYVPRVFRNSQAPSLPSLIPKDAFVLPPKHVLDVLIAAYFDEVHPGFPIINQSQFLDQYHDPNSSPPLILLQAVCLAGSHVTKAFKNNHSLKVSFFRRAKALLDGRYEEDRIEMVQAALLLTWFSDGGDDVCANAWWWIGIASRTAIGLGMHREVEPSNMCTLDKHTWRRTWWCLVQFDCLVSLCYGRPQNINLDDCDVSPLRPDDFDASMSANEVNFVLHHAELCAIISELVRTHFSVKARSRADNKRAAFDAVDAALAEWLVGLPPALCQQSSTRSSAGSEPWPLLLHLTYNTFLAQVHRSMAFRTSSDMSETDAAADEELCIDATSNIIQLFEQLSQQSALRRCWFWAPTPLFTALLHLRGQQRSNNPILALRLKNKYNSGLRSLLQLSKYWLFAKSVWRLFQSNSITAAPARPSMVPGADLDQRSPELDTSLITVSPLETSASHSAASMAVHTADQSQLQEMDWIQPLASGQSPDSLDAMHMERNRWQDSSDEWQTFYWSDPLASIRIPENFGEFRLEWAPP
ncbi:hypothetical protein GQ53DRAFT_845561 [Thozetella sp. PMI_491]|nr:hypothetical protein GQ53DRAFT_845561 [Thozetella sp. PMI_491]